jgi:hypothetical protein
MTDDDERCAPHPEQNIVGFVAYHLPKAIEFAEREDARIKASAAYWRGVYVARGYCPVGHGLDDPSCGYCINARALIAERNGT